MNDKIEDRILLCRDDSCCVRTVWKSKITPENGLFGPDHYTSYRCPQCDMPLVADPMLAHADESQDLLDEVLFYFERIDHMLNPEGKIHDLRHRIAKHLGGNR
tara:strand:+ start:1467 stop:1775 length:309 start_codon:yes stop_codon:yes gene_type:complete